MKWRNCLHERPKHAWSAYLSAWSRFLSPARFLQISIPLQSRLIEAQQLPGFLQGNLAGADGPLYVLAHARRQLVGGILHVVQHLADRIPLDDRVDVDLAAFIKTDVNGVGVAEQVVQVAKDFLIRAEEESPQIVRFAVDTMQIEGVAHIAQVDKLVHLAVRIASDIAQHGRAGWRLVEAMNRHNRK